MDCSLPYLVFLIGGYAKGWTVCEVLYAHLSYELCFWFLVDYCLIHMRSWINGKRCSRMSSLKALEMIVYVCLSDSMIIMCC